MEYLLAAVAVIAVVILATSARGVIATQKEWRRRQRLTPTQRALEDLGASFDRFAAAITEAMNPAVQMLNMTLTELADAWEAQTKLTSDSDTK